MHVLFICSRNRLRSPTAEAVFADCPGIETASAGTSPDAGTLVSADLIEWADLILVMEQVHQRKLNEKFSTLLKAKRISVLDIPDKYKFMQPELVALLEKRVTPLLKTKVSD